MILPSSRQLAIMRHILQSDKAISADVLASVMGTTGKTVRSDIVMINEILMNSGARIVSKSGTGYTLEIFNQVEFNIFSDSFFEKYRIGDVIPNYNEERMNFILYQFLTSDQPIRIEDLAAKMYISTGLLNQDLKEARKILDRYYLKLVPVARSGLSIQGNEEHIRICLTKYMHIDEDSSFENDLPLPVLMDLKGCTDVLSIGLPQWGIHLPYHALRNTARLIAIGKWRNDNGHFIRFSSAQKEELQVLEEYSVARHIYKEINVAVNEDEVCFLALYIASRRNYHDDDPFDLRDFKSQLFLCDDMLRYLFVNTDVSFLNDTQLRMSITKELRGMLLRLRYRIEHLTINRADTRSAMPAYEYAVLMAEYLKKSYDYDLKEPEIAILSLYLQDSLSRQDPNSIRQRVCLVLNQGANSSYEIRNLLNQNFSQLIESISIMEFHEISRNIDEKYDLIISDMARVKFNCSIPVLQIAGKFGAAELQKIHLLLLHQKEKTEKLLNAIKPELLLLHADYKNKEEAITSMCNNMQDKENIPHYLMDSVFERESMTPGCKGNNIAIIHSLYPCSEEPSVSIASLKHPIEWEDDYVQLIFLVSNGSKESYPFMILSVLYQAISDIGVIHELMHADDHKKILEIFKRQLLSLN